MNKKYILPTALILFIMLAVLINPSRYLASVTDGFILWWTAVLPALFPFFFFTRLLTGMGFPDAVGRLFEKPIKKLFHTPSISAYIFFMSILCGYPIGAKLISEFNKNNLITTEESKKIIAFCSTSAPLFVIGTVGNYMLGNGRLALLILISHYLSAIFTGLLFCNIRPLKNEDCSLLPVRSADDVMSESINGAVASVLSVGGLIAVFSLIIDILTDVGALTLFGDGFLVAATGILEMTRGCAELIKISPQAPITVAAATAFISFGGICVFTQAMTFLSTAKIKSSYYLAVKITQAAFGGLIGYILGLTVTG